jgi:hypothetical protein
MRKLPVALTVALATGCAMFHPVDSDAENVEVFTVGAPTSAFTKVAELAFWVPKSGMGEPTIDDILPELRSRAKHSGADAVMDVHWTLRGVKEYGVYQVTATGIAYAARATASESGSGSSRAGSTEAKPASRSDE